MTHVDKVSIGQYRNAPQDFFYFTDVSNLTHGVQFRFPVPERPPSARDDVASTLGAKLSDFVHTLGWLRGSH